MKRIIIVVKDGMVQNVYADTEDINITILDEDVEEIDEEQEAECAALHEIY
jgi:hypothetical protein